MAFTDDPFDPRRDRQMPAAAPMPGPSAAPAGGGGPTTGGSMPQGGAPAPSPGVAHGTGFVNLSRYISANQAGAQGMANAIGGDVAKMGAATTADAAQLQGEMAHSTAATAGAVDPALQAKLGPEAAQATMAAQSLQSPGGIGALLTTHYGQQGGYGSGMRGFDSFLAGNAGGAQFQQLGNQYGGLDKYVSGLGANYSPQAVNHNADPMHPDGRVGKSPPGMVSGGYPGMMPGTVPASAPPGLAVGAGGGASGGPGDKRKRRAF